ncbi:hypothetical protein LXL04_026779 [Taraxacum kok-saghyz]
MNCLKHSQIQEQELVSSGDNIYVMDCFLPSENPNEEARYRFQKLDFAEVKWVLREKPLGESALFLSDLKHGVATTSNFWLIRGQGLLVGHNAGDIFIYLERAHSFTTNYEFVFVNVSRCYEPWRGYDRPTNQNHDNDDVSSTRKRFKICDNGGAIYHVLYLVMMKLEIVDYLSFRGVFKSWRQGRLCSVAHSSPGYY